MIETPRYDSLAFTVFGRRERSISCDGHIFFFTTGTLQRLCEKARLQTGNFVLVGTIAESEARCLESHNDEQELGGRSG